MSSLTGRTVLITGGGTGIGLAMSSAVAAAGARVVIWGRRQSRLDEALQQLQSEGATAFAVACDVGDEQQVVDAFATSVQLVGGRIDSVFANAGRGGVAGKRFTDTSLSEWREVMRTNLDGVFLTFREAARHMVEQGGGALVAVSSTSAIHGAGGAEAYGTSKTALLGLVRALAVGLASRKVRVNALIPGWTDTDLAAAFTNEAVRNATMDRTPVKRWADPSELGPAAVYLADPALTFHTGDSLVVDGGYTIH